MPLVLALALASFKSAISVQAVPFHDSTNALKLFGGVSPETRNEAVCVPLALVCLLAVF